MRESQAQTSFEWAPDPRPTLEQRAMDFIARNPQVLDTFVRLAREAKRAGRNRVGAKALVERIRWELRTKIDDNPFRINNSYTSTLVRCAVHVAPELDGLFETRSRRKS